MESEIQVGNFKIGNNNPCFVIAEIGINHNGDIELAKQLIDAASEAGCQAVKFQKRTVEVVYSAEELAQKRETPFGETNGDLKRGLELGIEEYRTIDKYCKTKDILWFPSCWDEASVDFFGEFDLPCFKIASASLTDDNLLRHHRKTGKPILLSTGMSSMEEVHHALAVLGKRDVVLIHCTSTYPSKAEELNLNVIKKWKTEFPELPIGYSGHEVALASSLAAMCLGACLIERHITLDRSMWGSDQAASVEPQGMRKLVRDIRYVEAAFGDGIKKVFNSEVPIRKKLRRVG